MSGTTVAHVRTRVLRTPLHTPIVTPNYRISSVETVLVQVVDRDGQIGNGYLWCFEPAESAVLVAMLRCFGPTVVMSDGTIADVNRAIRRQMNFLGFKGVTVFALSALDMAMHDLTLRRAGTNLAHARGSRCDRVNVYWSGFFLSDSVAQWLAEADRVLAAGFTAVKIRVGAESLREDCTRLAALRSHLPTATTLMLDAVQRWAPEEALAAAQAFVEFDVTWLEDPLVHSDYRGTAEVVCKSPIPIATGENEYLPEGFDELSRTAVPILLADLERVGGITGWDGAAAIAARSTAMLTTHAYPHVGAQLIASGPDSSTSWVEYVPWWDDLMSYRLRIETGTLAVPDVVGIGIDWNDEIVDRLATEDWQLVGAR